VRARSASSAAKCSLGKSGAYRHPSQGSGGCSRKHGCGLLNSVAQVRLKPLGPSECDAHHSIPFGKVGCGLTTGGSLGGNFVAGQTYRDHAPPFEGRVSWLACRLMAVALMSLSCSDFALGKDNSEDSDGPVKSAALPNIYLDLRTTYATLPANTLSIGLGEASLFATLSNIATLVRPTTLPTAPTFVRRRQASQPHAIPAFYSADHAS